MTIRLSFREEVEALNYGYNQKAGMFFLLAPSSLALTWQLACLSLSSSSFFFLNSNSPLFLGWLWAPPSFFRRQWPHALFTFISSFRHTSQAIRTSMYGLLFPAVGRPEGLQLRKKWSWSCFVPKNRWYKHVTSWKLVGLNHANVYCYNSGVVLYSVQAVDASTLMHWILLHGELIWFFQIVLSIYGWCCLQCKIQEMEPFLKRAMRYSGLPFGVFNFF